MKNLFTLLFCLSSAELSFGQNVTQVQLEKGIIEGKQDVQSGVYIFFGVPYAKPPIGELRWTTPQELEPWTTPVKATNFGCGCTQLPVYKGMVFRSPKFSENCLFLNIWTKNINSKKPVLVYFHGGGLIAGDGSEPRYDGEAFAKEDIVVVTVNYRLGVFGFLAHPWLNQNGSSGNYGFLDQAMALKWVSENIMAFGGDPKQIVIGGESAGSVSVSTLMASDLTKGYLAGAFGESGAAIYPTFSPISLQSAQAVGVSFTTDNRISDLETLKSLNSETLIQMKVSTKTGRFPQTIDGVFLKDSLNTIFENQQQAQVPLLLGWNSAETSGSHLLDGQEPTRQNFESFVKKRFPNKASQLLKLLPHTTKVEIQQSLAQIASDLFINYSTWKWAELHAKAGGSPTYRYLFSAIRPEEANKVRHQTPVGAAHASEIEYFLGTITKTPQYKWQKKDIEVSKKIQSYLIHFIKERNPNHSGSTNWKAYIPENTNVMNLDHKPKLMLADDRIYHFWEEIFSSQPQKVK